MMAAATIIATSSITNLVSNVTVLHIEATISPPSRAVKRGSSQSSRVPEAALARLVIYALKDVDHLSSQPACVTRSSGAHCLHERPHQPVSPGPQAAGH
jgi:hypothetical protein